MKGPENAHHNRSMVDSSTGRSEVQHSRWGLAHWALTHHCIGQLTLLRELRLTSHFPQSAEEQAETTARWSIPFHSMLCHSSEQVGHRGRAVWFMVNTTDASNSRAPKSHALCVEAVLIITEEYANKRNQFHVRRAVRQLNWPETGRACIATHR
jgi:hypothetical protein